MASLVAVSSPPFAVGGAWAPEEVPRRRRETESSRAVRLLSRAKRERVRGELAEFRMHRQSNFRKLYDRGELPVRMVYPRDEARSVGWLVEDILKLDLKFYLPLFLSALDDPDEPFGFLALEAAMDVLEVAAPAKRLFTLGAYIAKPLKLALRSADRTAPNRAIAFLVKYATCCDTKHQQAALALIDLKAIAAAVDSAVIKHPSLMPQAARLFLLLSAQGGPHINKALRHAVPGFQGRYLLTNHLESRGK